MYHPRFKGNHYLMGQKLGKIFRDNKVYLPLKLDSFQKDFGRKSGKLLKKYFPEAAAEILGITDILKINNELFTSWMMCMGCCLDLDNDNTVEIRGCTAFSFVHNGKVYYGRNNDLPPFLRKVSKSIFYQPDNKNSFLLNTSSFVNGEEGINQYGLAAAMTFVVPKLNEIKPGINSLFLVRYILENCSNVTEGLEALRELPAASSCNILLADKSGEMLVVECNPNQINIRKPESNKNGENFIVTVNHFTSKIMRKHDASNRNVYYSFNRYQTVLNALENSKYNSGIIHAQKILSGQYGFICQYKRDLDFDTIWSSVFDISKNKIYRAEGNPRRTRYIEDNRLFN